MKKNYYFIAAAALAFAACSNEEILVENTPTNGSEVEIGFETYAEKQTRATENNQGTYGWLLEDHHETFSVWSTKLVASSYIPVHGDGKTTSGADGKGEVVTWSESNTAGTKDTWKPANKKYWDKGATTYYFYAAAPSTSAWVINNPSSKTNYEGAYFTISDFTLAGTNIADAEYSTTLNPSWKDAGGDVDLMIAADCPVSVSTINSTNKTVSLNFIHILSRLNVMLKKSADLDGAVVKVTDFQVKNLVSKGNFDESETAAVSANYGTRGRWTPSTTSTDVCTIQGVKYNATSNNKELSKTDAYYTVQSLVIPQQIGFEAIARNGADIASAKKPYFFVSYTIDDEPYEAYINLAQAFGKTKYQEKSVTTGETVKALYTKSGDNYVACGDSDVAAEGTKYYEKVADYDISFNEGWQNNLTITLDALEILFDANVSTWSDNENGGMTVE